jgi:c-di-GMP-binding flagellar brake protein YcgR
MRGAAVFEDRALIRFEAEDAAEVMQRRQFVRVQAPRPIALAAGEEPDAAAEPGAGEAPIGAHTIDLSGGGMLISGAHELAEGDTVRFSMTLGHGETPIAGMARVVRVRDDGRRALTFEQIDERDRQRLIRYIFECMRTARAKTRGDLM